MRRGGEVYIKLVQVILCKLTYNTISVVNNNKQQNKRRPFPEHIRTYTVYRVVSENQWKKKRKISTPIRSFFCLFSKSFIVIYFIVFIFTQNSAIFASWINVYDYDFIPFRLVGSFSVTHPLYNTFMCHLSQYTGSQYIIFTIAFVQKKSYNKKNLCEAMKAIIDKIFQYHL